MTDYATVGDAVRSTLLADVWFGNPAQMKTIEVFPRAFSLRENNDTLYFGAEEMPAIVIAPNVTPKTSEQISPEVIRSVIHVETAAVSWNRDGRIGLRNHLALVANIERVLEKQKTAQDDFGIGAVVIGVATRQEIFKKGEYLFFISRTVAAVKLIEPIVVGG
jgi:hypothetical protein